MDYSELLRHVDHTLLTPTATWDQVKTVCDEGLTCRTASVCIPPRYVKRAAAYVGNQLKICTVVGFPNGYSTPEVKVFETEDAIRGGADEIDMVALLRDTPAERKKIPVHFHNGRGSFGVKRAGLSRCSEPGPGHDLGLVKSGDWEGVLEEIKAVKASCKGRILKVIVEACLLTCEEKQAMCRIVSMSGADFIKTSTGFSTGGATYEDVKLFREHCSPDVRIKAAGGIRTLEEAQTYLELGADRIGSSGQWPPCRPQKWWRTRTSQ